MSSPHLVYLLVYLNSPRSEYLFSKLDTTTGAGTIRWKKYKIEQQLVPIIPSADERRIVKLYRSWQKDKNEAYLHEAYHITYKSVGLTEEEIQDINSLTI